MSRFPVDAPKQKVLRALERLGFQIVRERNHISMVRENPDGSKSRLVMPNHRRIKGSTLRQNMYPIWDFQSRISGSL